MWNKENLPALLVGRWLGAATKEKAWKVLRKLKIELSHDPAIPLPGICSNKTLIQKGPCTPMFIAAWFTIAKTRKPPKCPLREGWIEKMWCIHTMEHYSVMKNEWNSAICSRMQLETIILREVIETKTSIIWHHLHVESNTWHKWSNLQSRNRHTDCDTQMDKQQGPAV